MPKNPHVQGHHKDCDLEHRYNELHPPGYKAFWCAVHQQWDYEFPVKTVFEFADGTKLEAIP